MLFPPTRHSLLAALKTSDVETRARAIEVLVAAYWSPAYKYLRLRWQRSAVEAEDLTQEFFAGALQSELFHGYQAGRARFRTFLRSCLDHFVQNADRSAARLKRGGDAVRLGLDFPGAERELAQAGGGSADPEVVFETEWVRHLMGLAVEGLRRHFEARNKAVYFRIFERIDLADGDVAPSYAQLAAELGIAVHDVANHLSAARRELRKQVLSTLAEITTSDEELREEAAALGIALPD